MGTSTASDKMVGPLAPPFMEEMNMNKYEALMALREIYTSPLLDLALKAKLKEIIEVLEAEI